MDNTLSEIQSDLNDNILNYNSLIWEHRLIQRNIDDWLSNFKETESINEKKMALELLNAFIYYNEKEVKYLCKNVYSEFKQWVIHDLVKKGLSIHNASREYENNREIIRFAQVGRPSESGCFILYYFRQENELPLQFFLERWDEINNTIKYLVLVDDFLGTGETIDNFLGSSVCRDIRKQSPDIKFFYLPLIALQDGYTCVKKKYPDVEILYSQLFSDEYRVFSAKSYLYYSIDPTKRTLLKEACYEYGERLEGADFALGFNNSQVLIGFHHNVPDNTLPIIWSENSWTPIFSRKKKKESSVV